MKAVASLQSLAALKAGHSFRGGRWVAVNTLYQLPYPPKLIRLVLPFVFLSRWEWEDLHREYLCDLFSCTEEEFLRIRSFYNHVYGEIPYYRDFCREIVV
jgi:hypothetical protein